MDTMISVIIPVYNMEKYVGKCIESVLNQTYKNLEIILVNDGSQDNSYQICKEYLKDSRVRLFNKENGGLSDARNYGLNEAQGEWIYFLDSDDWLNDNVLEILLNSALKSNALMAIGRLYLTYDREQIFECDGKLQKYTTIEALAEMCKGVQFEFQACHKLIKREIMQGIEFPVGKYYEDAFTTYKYVEKAGIICYCPNAVYYYYQRGDSIVNEKFNPKKMDWLYACKEFYEFCEKTHPELLKYAQCNILFASISLINMIFKSHSDGKYDKEIALLIDTITENKKVLNEKIEARCMKVKYKIAIGVLLFNKRVYSLLLNYL